jgi:peptidyl-prolyl cis-trans isomerase C
MRLPSFPRWALAAGVGLLATFSGGRGTFGAPPASPVVAKVGAVTITAADLERRLAMVPPFQLRTFGATPADIKRAFLERVLVREALLSQGAVDRGLEARDDVKERTRNVLRTAILSRLRAEAVSAGKVDEPEIKAYYDKNAAKFHSPERYQLWIIATHKADEAQAVITEMKKDGNPARWRDMARNRSIDTATAMRGGELNWVNPDGTTTEPGLKVSGAVMAGVGKLKDTEISPEPVQDGDRWVVIWRRQTMKPVDRPIEAEVGSIRQLLLHTRTDAKIKETVAALRKQSLSDHNPELIDLFDISPQGDLTPVRRPGALPAGRRAPVSPVPAPGNLR